MPVVGMRRTTRVFGARVLRSGRRLWSRSGQGKHMRAAAACAPTGEEWIELIDSSEDCGGNVADDGVQWKENGREHDLKQEVAVMDIDVNLAELKPVGTVGETLLKHNNNFEDRMWACVYRRKRKRVDSNKSFDLDGSLEKKRALECRKYGKQFVRKHWRKKSNVEICPCPSAESCAWQGSSASKVLAAVVQSSFCGRSSLFACLLNLVLRYMKRAKLMMSELSAFLFSEPLAHVFSSHGIDFLRGCPIKRPGLCKIFGARCFIPSFAVDFSAVPFCFAYLHSTLLLRSSRLPHVVVPYSNVTGNRMTEVVDHLPCITSERDSLGTETVKSWNDDSEKSDNLYSAVGAPRLTGRALQFRNVISRSIQKRRSSLRSKRMKNPVFRKHKANSALLSNLFGSKHDGVMMTPLASDTKLRNSVRKSSRPNIKELKSSLVGLRQDIVSVCCSANILVIESDKCYRITGAVIKLEILASKQWSLAVKKDGITKYSLFAQKVMRPCSSNRVTHDLIWTEDINSWKLEFPNRQDWLIFKELYKECFDRNLQVPSGNVIPVPGVHEVSGYADSNTVPFRQPKSYISVRDDELSRALAKKTANYDMDSEDEEWLREFNMKFSAGNEAWEVFSEENFELLIDAFERAFYCSPDNYSDEKAPISLGLGFERKEVVEGIYSYWTEKRKRKGASLLSVFQCYHPRRDQLLPKPILRKKRSLKRQPSQSVRGGHPGQSGRGKQRTFLQAMAAEQESLEEQKAMHRVQQAKAAATISEGRAVGKRQIAQLLMENADLVAYKAAMAIRIAEAAEAAESAEAAALILD